MQISQLLKEDGILFDGNEITIEGIFVMVHGIGYFIENEADKDSKNMAIAVCHPELEKRLLACVPAFGGSKYSYCNAAKISGKLRLFVDPEFYGIVDNISNFLIYIENEPFVVKF